MLKIAIGNSPHSSSHDLITPFSASDRLETVRVCNTGKEAAELARRGDIHAFVFAPDWAETCRAIRLTEHDSPSRFPAFVLASHEVTKTLLVKSLLYGFEGVVAMTDEPLHIVQRIEGIVEGSISIVDEPPLRNLNLRHGLLARELVVDNPDDQELAQLVGAGLPDSEIADLLGWNIQHVRNRVEHLITANGLSYRTQLAVLSSSVWRIPDFR